MALPPRAQDAKALTQRITDYLVSGGLFNPEIAIHDRVRDLLMDCREWLEAVGEAPVTPQDAREAYIQRTRESTELVAERIGQAEVGRGEAPVTRAPQEEEVIEVDEDGKVHYPGEARAGAPDLRALILALKQKQDRALRQSIALHERQAYEAAAHDRGESDAYGVCVQLVEAALRAEGQTGGRVP